MRGRVAFAISLYPVVWPTLWTEVVACASPAFRSLSDVWTAAAWNQFYGCLRRLLLTMHWAAAVMVIAPALFAVLAVICLVAKARSPA